MSPRWASPFIAVAIVSVIALSSVCAFSVTLSSDSSAFVDDDAGYSVDIKNGAKDSEMNFEIYSIGAVSKNDIISNSTMPALLGAILNIGNVVHYTLDGALADDYSMRYAAGSKIEGLERTDIECIEFNADGLFLRYVAKSTGVTFIYTDNYESTSDNMKVANALSNYFGKTKVNTGDIFEISGSAHFTEVKKTVTHIETVDGSKCVSDKMNGEMKNSLKYDLTVKYIPISGTAKSIKITSDSGANYSIDVENRYFKEVSELKDGDKCRVKYTLSDVPKSIFKYQINGKEYEFDFAAPTKDDIALYGKDLYENKQSEVDDTVSLNDTETVMKAITIPSSVISTPSSDNVIIKTTYDDAMNMYNEMKANEDKTMMFYIMIGAGVAVAVMAVVFIVSRIL